MYVLCPPMPKNYIIIFILYIICYLYNLYLKKKNIAVPPKKRILGHLGEYLINDRTEQGNNQIWEPTGVSLVQAAAGSNLNSNNSFTTVYSTNSR